MVAAATAAKYEVLEVGIMHPEQEPTTALYDAMSPCRRPHAPSTLTKRCSHRACLCLARFTGQVGYVILGMRSAKEARVGDTIFHLKQTVTPLPGFQPAKSMVCARVRDPASADR